MIAESTAIGGPGWVVAVNLVIWSGLFIYLLRLERRFGGRSGENGDRMGGRSDR